MKLNKIITALLILFAVSTASVRAEVKYVTERIEPFKIRYSVRSEGIIDKEVTIRSAFAESFSFKSGLNMLYMIFYPWELYPWQWRDAFDFKTKDPENYLIIKFNGRIPPPLTTGVYPDVPMKGTPSNPEAGYITPVIITAKGEYVMPPNSGVMTIKSVYTKVGKKIEGRLDYESEDLSLHGEFRAFFIVDK